MKNSQLKLKIDNNSNLIKISGKIKKIIYYNTKNDYAIIQIEDKKLFHCYTVCGLLVGIFTGLEIEVYGKWENHRIYGEQIRVYDYQFALPNTLDGIEKFLISAFKGIGPKKAKIIVNYFGIKTIDIIDQDINKLNDISKLDKKSINSIKNSWHKILQNKKIISFLQSLNISSNCCNKIYNEFKNRSIEVLKSNPYLLLNRIHGMSFKRIDVIAKKIGVNNNDTNRIIAIIQFIISENTKKFGHTCYPLEKFFNIKLDEFEITTSELKNGLVYACENNLIKIDKIILFPNVNNCLEKVVYNLQIYNYEFKIAKKILEILNFNDFPFKKLKKINNPNKNNFYNKDQLNAIDNIYISPISIITGGPGVGKTTVINEIVKIANKHKLKITLTAPTGKASNRLENSTKHKSSTIHRLLKWDVINKSFIFNNKNKLKSDLLIIDESSMIDLILFYNLIISLNNKISIVFVGDIDQLPPIGPGCVLKDLINCNIFPVARLNIIYRQKNRYSQIIYNAHRIKNGKLIYNNPRSDFHWLKFEDDNPEDISRVIFSHINEEINKANYNIKNIQILSPIIDGYCGINNLNVIFQNLLNKSNINKKHIVISNKKFFIGDKVIQLVNNYDNGIFNGDIGFIQDIKIEEKIVEIEFNNKIIEYKFENLDEINLAYAITIHKSQGSEFEIVIMPCINSHNIMLQRNLLYTAITRAKRLFILIGSKRAVLTAINNCKYKSRYSGLLYRLLNH